MRALIIAAVLGSMIAGHALAGLAPIGDPELDAQAILAAVADAEFTLPGVTHHCIDVPGAPFSGVCGGAEILGDGPACQGAGATSYAFHEVYADVAVTDRRAGVFLYCADFPEPNGPGTELYYTVVLVGMFDDAGTPGPTIFWYEVGGIAEPGAKPHYECYVEVYLAPMGLLTTQPCIVPPPHAPALPA